jgi:protein ImuB
MKGASMAKIPSYDDLEPPISDIGTGVRDKLSQLALLFTRQHGRNREALQARRAHRASETSPARQGVTVPSRAAPLFACVYRAAGPATPGLPEDRSADAALVALAREFSPRIEVAAAGVVLLDVAGLTRLLGDAAAIGAEIRCAAATRGLAVHVAVASTRTAALLTSSAKAGVTIVPSGAEAAQLAVLPLRALGRLASGFGLRKASGREPGQAPSPEPGASRRARTGASSRHYRMAPNPRGKLQASQCGGWSLFDVLARWGINTLGGLARLPSTDLFARLGEDGILLQRLARGEDLLPLVPACDPERFDAVLPLEWPVEGLEPLSFVLGRVLDPLCAKLEAHDRGAATLHVRLRLVTREVHTRRLELPAPFRDARVLRTLILLDLESHPPPAGVDEIAVAIDPAPGRVTQGSLLQRAVPSPEDLSTLTARLAALMGKGRCGAPVLLDTHRPGAFALSAFTGEANRASGASRVHRAGGDPGPASAFRRFRMPLAARVMVRDGHPIRVAAPGCTGDVIACAGPWRTSGCWWSEERTTAAARWNRDEWDVAVAGAVYRLFCEDGQWYLEGIVD